MRMRLPAVSDAYRLAWRGTRHLPAPVGYGLAHTVADALWAWQRPRPQRGRPASSRNIEKLSVSSSRLRLPSTTSCLARTSTTSVSANTTIRSRLASRGGLLTRASRSRGLRPYRLLKAAEKLKGLAYPTWRAMADTGASPRALLDGPSR